MPALATPAEVPAAPRTHVAPAFSELRAQAEVLPPTGGWEVEVVLASEHLGDDALPVSAYIRSDDQVYTVADQVPLARLRACVLALAQAVDRLETDLRRVRVE